MTAFVTYDYLRCLSPVWWPVVGALLLLLVDLPPWRQPLPTWLGVGTLLFFSGRAVLGIAHFWPADAAELFSREVALDRYGSLAELLVLVTGAGFGLRQIFRAEHPTRAAALALIAITAAELAVSANDVLLLLIALEVVFLATPLDAEGSKRAALGSAILCLGCTLLYHGFASTEYSAMRQRLANQTTQGLPIGLITWLALGSLGLSALLRGGRRTLLPTAAFLLNAGRFALLLLTAPLGEHDYLLR